MSLENVEDRAIRHDIRGDPGFSPKAIVGGVIGILIVVLIFVSLIGQIQSSVNNANLTNTAADTLLLLIPLLAVVGLVLAIVGWAMSTGRL